MQFDMPIPTRPPNHMMQSAGGFGWIIFFQIVSIVLSNSSCAYSALASLREATVLIVMHQHSNNYMHEQVAIHDNVQNLSNVIEDAFFLVPQHKFY